MRRRDGDQPLLPRMRRARRDCGCSAATGITLTVEPKNARRQQLPMLDRGTRRQSHRVHADRAEFDAGGRDRAASAPRGERFRGDEGARIFRVVGPEGRSVLSSKAAAASAPRSSLNHICGAVPAGLEPRCQAWGKFALLPIVGDHIDFVADRSIDLCRDLPTNVSIGPWHRNSALLMPIESVPRMPASSSLLPRRAVPQIFILFVTPPLEKYAECPVLRLVTAKRPRPPVVLLRAMAARRPAARRRCRETGGRSSTRWCSGIVILF